MGGVTDPPLADHPDGPDAALVRAEATVPGTPDEVWWSVATGPGIGTWFVPARVEERVGGAVVTDHGPFGFSRGTVVAHESPRRFAYEERDWGADVPPWRTELLVEPAGDGACRVHLTSGVTTGGARHRAQVEATAEGWAAGLRNLRLARTHFPGQEAGSVFVVRAVRQGPEDAWVALVRALGLADAAVGDEVVGAAGAPVLAGVVEEVGRASLLLRTSAPAPGLVELSVHEMASTSFLVHAHLFGAGGPAVAEAERPRWDAWLHARFPGARPT
jgi:hypothetical protein